MFPRLALTCNAATNTTSRTFFRTLHGVATALLASKLSSSTLAWASLSIATALLASQPSSSTLAWAALSVPAAALSSSALALAILSVAPAALTTKLPSNALFLTFPLLAALPASSYAALERTSRTQPQVPREGSWVPRAVLAPPRSLAGHFGLSLKIFFPISFPTWLLCRWLGTNIHANWEGLTLAYAMLMLMLA